MQVTRGSKPIAFPITSKQGFAASREPSSAYLGRIQRSTSASEPDVPLQAIEWIGFINEFPLRFRVLGLRGKSMKIAES